MINKTTELNKITCRICNSSNTAFYCKKEGYNIMRCRDCGCGFLDLNNVLFDPLSFYQTYYNSGPAKDFNRGYDNYFALEKPFKLAFKRRLDKLLSYQKFNLENRSLLDIGCGPGFFLDLASKYFDVHGVEISRQAAEYAKNKLNLKVVNDSFRSGLFSHSQFDIVTLWDTIEHINNPDELLHEISNILKNNGILAFTTGDFESIISKITRRKWHLLTIPEHLFFFSKHGMRRLLRKHNFEVTHIGYPVNYVTLDYILERLVKSFEFANDYRKLKKTREFFNRFVLKANLFDIMFVVAIKRSSEWFKNNAKKKLVINADDFGLAKGINNGIISAYKKGIVSSASIITAAKHADDAIKLAKENPGLEVGIHLVLVEEKPISPPESIPSLINDKGLFYSNYFEFGINYLMNKVKLSDIEKEFRAQIEKLRKSGIEVAHIDSHQYLHMFPPILKIVIRLAKENKIKFIRLPKANMPSFNLKELFLYFLSIGSIRYLKENNIKFSNRVEGIKTAGRLNRKKLEQILSNIKEGVTELICHPGFADEEYKSNYSHWRYNPESELESLCDPSLKNLLEDKEIVISNKKSSINL